MTNTTAALNTMSQRTFGVEIEAYGANTNKASMARRCPLAKPHGGMILSDHRLAFRGVADVVHEKGRKVFGASWPTTILVSKGTAMSFKVQLHHKLNIEPCGLFRGRVSGLETADTFNVFLDAQRAMTVWLDRAERRETWRGEVVPSQVVAA